MQLKQEDRFPADTRRARRRRQEETKDPVTRKELKKKRKEEGKKHKKPRRRAFPIWLRLVVIILLAAVALASGLMIGYGVIDDAVPIDALKKETCQHIIDIVIKKYTSSNNKRLYKNILQHVSRKQCKPVVMKESTFTNRNNRRTICPELLKNRGDGYVLDIQDIR